jgi:hypothetical protein
MKTATFFELKKTNRVALAKSRLNAHRAKGNQSDLSVFEAARLMDVVVFNQQHESADDSGFKIFLN